MGALFSSGWTLDEVLDLTWNQLGFVVGSVQLHKQELVGALQDTLIVCLGGKPPNRKKKTKPKSKVEKQTSDALKLKALSALGISITEET